MRICHYRPAALLSVKGEDAATYLQGQFTNDLRKPAGATIYGLWLDQKGRVLADSHVFKLGENEFLVASTTSPVEVIRPRLEKYIVADDVLLTDETGETHGLLLSGPHCSEVARQVLGAVPQPGCFLQLGGMLLFNGRRIRGENHELIGPEDVIIDARQKLLAAGGREISAEEMEFARIMDGIPSIPSDLGPGDLPNEGGLENEAISYTKGCYLGQEVIARIKNKGRIRRRLHVVQGTGRLSALAPLYQGGKSVGQVRSVAIRGNETVAMAMLSLMAFDPTIGLGLTADSAPTFRIKT